MGQLQTESLLVDRLEETRTKGAMHFNCSTYRLVDECVQLGARLFGGPHPKSSSDAKGWLREFIAQEFVPPRSPERGMMSFRPRPGSGLPGRVVRPLTNALVRIMSGRSARPGNPDEAKGGRRDPVLALLRLGGSIPPGPSTVALGPYDLLAPQRLGGSSTSPLSSA